jgi:acetyl esterase/lipase
MDWRTMSRAERDAAYNNRAAVPDAARLIAEREAACRGFRAIANGVLDLPYGPGERQRWDLFPAADPNAPCLVFIHGGYWQMNRREDFCVVAEGMREHGWAAALPGYTLAPEATMTEIVAEIGRALDWLAARGALHGISGPVVLSGYSAGGHLAALGLAHPRVAAGLAISGIFELGPLRDTYLNEKLALTDAEVATLSPLRLPAVAKRLAIAYGTGELPALVADSRALHAQRAAAHMPGALLPIAGADHFTILDALRRPDGDLARHLRTLLPA